MDKIRTIDQGNSHPHVGLYHQGRLEQVLPIEEFLELDFAQDEGQILALSTVGPESEVLKKMNGKWCNFKEKRGDHSFAEMPVHYTQRLGDDRLFQAYYIFEKFSKGENGQSILLIDAGTFTTFDLIDKEGYQGGIIIPGERTYFDTFEKGANLPSLEHGPNFTGDEKIPQDTEDAIITGRRWLMEGLFDRVISKYSPQLIIYTGGHGKMIYNILKEQVEIPSTFIPHLIHDSLYFMAKQFPPDEGGEA